MQRGPVKLYYVSLSTKVVSRSSKLAARNVYTELRRSSASLMWRLELPRGSVELQMGLTELQAIPTSSTMVPMSSEVFHRAQTGHAELKSGTMELWNCFKESRSGSWKSNVIGRRFEGVPLSSEEVQRCSIIAPQSYKGVPGSSDELLWSSKVFPWRSKLVRRSPKWLSDVR